MCEQSIGVLEALAIQREEQIRKISEGLSRTIDFAEIIEERCEL